MRLQLRAARGARPDERGSAPPRLHGRRLFGVRAAWVILALTSLGLFIASVPYAYLGRQAVCTGSPCPVGYLSLETARGLHDVGLSTGAYAAYIIALDVIFALGYMAVGIFIFWRKSDDPMALFAALALVLFGATWPIVTDLLAAAPAPLQWLARAWEPLGFAAFVLLIYLFPDGRFVPRWMRWLALVGLVWQMVVSLLPGSPVDSDTWPAPLRGAVDLSLFSTLVISQVYRYVRVSTPTQRQQTKWVAFGVSLTIVGGASLLLLGVLFPAIDQPGRAHVIFDLVGRTVFGTLALLIIPLAIAVAILRYRLWDIDILINRTLVYGALTAGIVGIYVLAVGYLGALFRTPGNPLISLVVTGLVAVLFQPLREWLQHGINRLLYGYRDDPYGVIARLGARLEATLAPEAVLPTLVETVAQALKLPYVAVMLKQGDVFVTAAEAGDGRWEMGDGGSQLPQLPAPNSYLPLIYQGEMVGKLLLAPRTPGETFSPADQRLLAVLAQQAGAAAHAVRLTADLQQLTADLQHSRERLISAREEERRRLRRDLHDGVGPTLASLSQRLDAATYMVRDRPDETIVLLQDLKAQVRATVADIRRVVYALRPPVLDEFGLLSAIREHAAQYAGAAGPGGVFLNVVVEAPEELPPLPAAVELAAYRIALEALTNAVRHARATTCHIQFAIAGVDGRPALSIEVRDDGAGLPADHRVGVGLSSMRERAAELGGVCTVDSPPAGGTRVRAYLPL